MGKKRKHLVIPNGSDQENLSSNLNLVALPKYNTLVQVAFFWHFEEVTQFNQLNSTSKAGVSQVAFNLNDGD